MFALRDVGEGARRPEPAHRCGGQAPSSQSVGLAAAGATSDRRAGRLDSRGLAGLIIRSPAVCDWCVLLLVCLFVCLFFIFAGASEDWSLVGFQWRMCEADESQRRAFWNWVKPFFMDPRYMRVDNKPIFSLYRSDQTARSDSRATPSNQKCARAILNSVPIDTGEMSALIRVRVCVRALRSVCV